MEETDLIAECLSGCCPGLCVPLQHHMTQSATASAKILPGKASSPIHSQRNPALVLGWVSSRGVFYTPPPARLRSASLPRKHVLGVTWVFKACESMCQFQGIVNGHHMPLSFDKMRRNSSKQWNTV